MAQAVTLQAQLRSGQPKAVRRQEMIPAVVYGHGITAESIQVNAKAFAKIFDQSGYTTLVNLDVAGREHNVLIREVQWHPLKDHATHVDFYQVRLDEKVRAEVPLEFVGEADAVTKLNGVLVKSLDALDIEALPQNLPHDIQVDITVLKDFDAVIKVSDLVLPDGIEVFNESDEVVALVQPPRSEQELEALSEEATEDVDSVEGIKKEEPAAEDGAEAEKADETKKAE